MTTRRTEGDGRRPVTRGPRGRPAPEVDTTMSGVSWEGEDLSGRVLSRVRFVDLDLAEAVNRGAVFTECDFRGARFNASLHDGAAFVNCAFRGCNFFDARFSGCKLVGSVFDRCTFEVTAVEGGDWSLVGLSGADLRSASFRGVRMREADLTGARCEGAALRDLDLSGALLHGADLSRCDLRGSDLGSLDPESVRLRGAVVTMEQAIAIAERLGLDVRPD